MVITASLRARYPGLVSCVATVRPARSAHLRSPSTTSTLTPVYHASTHGVCTCLRLHYTSPHKVPIWRFEWRRRRSGRCGRRCECSERDEATRMCSDTCLLVRCANALPPPLGTRAGGRNDRAVGGDVFEGRGATYPRCLARSVSVKRTAGIATLASPDSCACLIHQHTQGVEIFTAFMLRCPHAQLPVGIVADAVNILTKGSAHIPRRSAM